MSRATKAWGGARNVLRRKEREREQRKLYLIVCEGTKTEPNYFRAFRANTIVEPAGLQHLALVQHAIALRSQTPDRYDEVWCVFDRDKYGQNPNDVRNFSDALQLAESNNIKVAYSNDAFELWYVLHFEYLSSSIPRRDYVRKLRRLMPGGYRKNDANTYGKLEGLLGEAIKRAERLLTEYDPSRPAHDDPSTTVHLLVTELMRG